MLEALAKALSLVDKAISWAPDADASFSLPSCVLYVFNRAVLLKSPSTCLCILVYSKANLASLGTSSASIPWIRGCSKNSRIRRSFCVLERSSSPISLKARSFRMKDDIRPSLVKTLEASPTRVPNCTRSSCITGGEMFLAILVFRKGRMNSPPAGCRYPWVYNRPLPSI